MVALEDRRQTHIHKDKEATLGKFRHYLPMGHGEPYV